MSADPLPPTPAPTPARRPRRHLAWLGAGAATLALVTGGSAALAASAERPTTVASDTATDTATDETAPDGAEPGHRGPRGPHGTVTAIDGATLTIETPDGTVVTVTTTAETEVVEMTEEGRADIAVADIEVGDSVGVRPVEEPAQGEEPPTAVTAEAIHVGDLPGPGGPGGPGGHGGRGGPGGEDCDEAPAEGDAPADGQAPADEEAPAEGQSTATSA